MNKIGADECNAAFAVTFFLTTLVNISLLVLFCFLQFFFTILTVGKGYPD